MRTQSQSETNRANAQHSTGPRTGAGKSTSSRNSLKHGLSAGFTLLQDEDPDAFAELLLTLEVENNPETEHESFLVSQLAQSRWKLDRIARLEAQLFEHTLAGGDVSPQLALMLRYTTSTERAYYKAEKELRESQSRRQAAARAQAQAESQRNPQPDPQQPPAEPQFRPLTLEDLERLTRPPLPPDDFLASFRSPSLHDFTEDSDEDPAADMQNSN